MVDFKKLENLVEYFKALEPSRIDQEWGAYSEECGCCVGAHLAHCLAGTGHYLDGIDDLYEAVYGSPPGRWPAPAQETAGKLRGIEVRLTSHGAGSDNPFGTHPWVCPPHEVFQGLIAELREEQAKA